MREPRAALVIDRGGNKLKLGSLASGGLGDDSDETVPQGAPLSVHRALPLLLPLLLLLAVLAFEEDGSLASFTWQRPIEPESDRPAVILFGDSVDRFAVLDYCAAPAPPGRRRFLCSEGISRIVAAHPASATHTWSSSGDCTNFDSVVSARRAGGGPCLRVAVCVERDDGSSQPAPLHISQRSALLFFFNPFGVGDVQRLRLGRVPGRLLYEEDDADKAAVAFCCASESTRALRLQTLTEAAAASAPKLLASVGVAKLTTPAILAQGLFWDVADAVEDEMRQEFDRFFVPNSVLMDPEVDAWAKEWAKLTYGPAVLPFLELVRESFARSFGEQLWVAWRTGNTFGPPTPLSQNAFVESGIQAGVAGACSGGFPVVDFRAEFEAKGGRETLRDGSHPGPSVTVPWVEGIVKMLSLPRSQWPSGVSSLCRGSTNPSSVLPRLLPATSLFWVAAALASIALCWCLPKLALSPSLMALRKRSLAPLAVFVLAGLLIGDDNNLLASRSLESVFGASIREGVDDADSFSCMSSEGRAALPCVVATLSTMPKRVALLRPVIESLLAQQPAGIVARVEINIPFFNERTGENYSLPAWLFEEGSAIAADGTRAQSFFSFGGRVRVVRTPDLGSITKVAPTLLRYANSEGVYIWSVDDDTLYSEGSLAGLLEAEPLAGRLKELHGILMPLQPARPGSFPAALAAEPLKALSLLAAFDGSLLAYSGFEIIDEGGSLVSSFGKCEALTFAQVFRGFRSALYPPRLLRGAEGAFARYVELTSANADCRVSDDVVLSNFLEARGVARFIADSSGLHDAKLPQDGDGDATHAQSGGHARRYARVVAWLRSHAILTLGAGRTTCL